MNVKPAFIYLALAGVIFGLLFTLIPALTLSIFEISLSTEGLFFVRLFGAALIGYSVIAWSARDDPPSEARRHIILGEIYHSGIATIILVFGLIQGIGNLLLLLPLAVHLSLTLWFGYLYIRGTK
ncbi:MAG: hypothetical protein ACNA8H_04925 [Anaerolineales bacterium]|jgi:hypothetical protein